MNERIKTKTQDRQCSFKKLKQQVNNKKNSKQRKNKITEQVSYFLFAIKNKIDVKNQVKKFNYDLPQINLNILKI
ncbi:hypothetical protein TTHERM_01232290 (macronuclear) [Tetrahymena thermophila SB210]|uniref:Uncharacterized protein n=1 Tax=Tetrahymena thermophila (strain SB210) TaxID=312017 RepID=Q24DF8_TETTS|nr:hypothetical protein TTHERM_01232290 [Tetrahymena thermophila SB210]EAS05820.1 hypothetical protein TTHERM_01232290 [Tetrahymena thermophila SB210]|eukprot:XP_001026065.1 hypothetical protein TTHERM_01232290 [Tetrahymena thermophila SB210]